MELPPTPPDLDLLLHRPPEQRLREYKYRCAQAMVFGLPVVLLHYFGDRLGGPESVRWSALLQALLGGWVMYVGGAGMLFEGMLVLKQRLTMDLVVSTVATMLYAYSLIVTLALLAPGAAGSRATVFHLSVFLIALWTAIQWLRLNWRDSPSKPPTRCDK